MVLVFGVDVPLIELIIGFAITLFLLAIEIIIIMIVLFYQLRNAKNINKKIMELSKILLELKEKELELRRHKKE